MTLTQKDIDEIKKIVNETLEFKFPNLTEKIDNILTLLNDLAGKINKVEEEQTVQGHQISELRDNLNN